MNAKANVRFYEFDDSVMRVLSSSVNLAETPLKTIEFSSHNGIDDLMYIMKVAGDRRSSYSCFVRDRSKANGEFGTALIEESCARNKDLFSKMISLSSRVSHSLYFWHIVWHAFILVELIFVRLAS